MGHRLLPLLQLVFSLLCAPAFATDAGRDPAEGFWVAQMPGRVNLTWGVRDDGQSWGIPRASPSNTAGLARFTAVYLPLRSITLTTAIVPPWTALIALDHWRTPPTRDGG